jgi:hypothetical protein
MTQHSHQTAPTQFVDAAGVRFAYRRFGKSGGVPLVFNIHFTGTMDHWDPAVTDDLAATREVILFNNAGISSTSGEVPASVEEMAANAAAINGSLSLHPTYQCHRNRSARAPCFLPSPCAALHCAIAS